MLDWLENFHFLRPWWLAMALPLVFLIYVWVRRTRQRSAWSNTISPALLAVLLDENAVSAATRLRTALWSGTALALLSLAGPTWEKLPQPVAQKNDALVIVLDLSLSMFAQDIAPSRLLKARQKIVDTLRLRDEGSTGLVAYAGDAHAVVPITDDANTIENLLGALSPAMMPVLGSRPGAGLDLAQELFANAGLLEGKILLITDGITSANEVSDRRNPAFPISILGVGSESGDRIPINRPGESPRYLTDESGRQVIARLNPDPMIQAAQRSYGRYSSVSIGDSDLNTLLGASLPSEDESIEVEREFDIWADMGFWLCLPLGVLMLASFRRGLFAATLLCLSVPLDTWANDTFPASAAPSTPLLSANDPPTSQSFGPSSNRDQNPPAKEEFESWPQWWQDLWLRPDQQGYRALQQNKPGRAASAFQDRQWRGAANYRNGQFAESLEDFAQQDDDSAIYNQGNALAQLGRYADAIEQYDQVLSRQPDHADAAFNKALVEELLQQQQQSSQSDQQQQEQQQQQQQDSEQEDQQSQDQGSEEQEQSSEQEQESEAQPDQERESEQEREQQQVSETETEQAQRDEEQEALEQWLRRVPDDPGGLLRRKFQHETNQRLRQGDYQNRQDEQIW